MLAGMIADVRTITTKKGDPMAFVQLEDVQGQCEVVVFPRTYAEVKELLVQDNIVLVKGNAQTREGQTSLLADSIQTYIDQAVAKEDETLQYQEPLLDVGPTINGVKVANDALHEDGSSYDFGAHFEDPQFVPDEASPFRDDPPGWIEETGSRRHRASR